LAPSKVDVGEAPSVAIRDLRAEAIHIVVVAVDGDDLRSINRGAENLVWLEVVRDENVTGKAKACRVRRDAVGQVAGRRAAEHREAKLHVTGRGNRDDAILVREGRMVDRVVLDVELGDAKLLRKPIRFDERREP